jgi:hypothetical protein
MLRPGEEKHILIRYGLAQYFRPFLPAVDLLLVAPDGNMRMALELGFKLLDERQISAGIAQEDGRHPTEASYVGNRGVPYRKVECRSRQRGPGGIAC